MERELTRANLDPRSVSVRQVITLAWSLVTEHLSWWQTELLLADAATWVKDNAAAERRLDALVKTNRVPKAEFSRVRRQLFYARMRKAGRQVPGD